MSTIGGIVEYAVDLVDDLVDYRANGYRVVIAGSSDLPQFGVWDEYVMAETVRRSLEPFERFDNRSFRVLSPKHRAAGVQSFVMSSVFR